MTTTFDQDSARYYEFVHGRKPRGEGMWSFQLHRYGSSTEERVSGTYADAKKRALAVARELGCYSVTVNT